MSIVKGLIIVTLFGFTAAVNAKQTVHFYAWGGSPQVNSYIRWVKEQVSAQFDIELVHVKLADTSDAVSRVLAEKSAGNHEQGMVDLIWINGENFAAMSKQGLLKKQWAFELSNFALTHAEKNPAVRYDFGIPTQGQEAPWGRAAMVFYYNQAHISDPPKSLTELKQFAAQHPGRFTYPQPSDFLGISFLKYALSALNPDKRQWLYQPVTDEHFAELTTTLWSYLDELHPTLWRQGELFLKQNALMPRLFDDGELLLGFSFTAAEIPSAVSRFDLPETTRTYAMEDGSLANIHFVAIPYNTSQFSAAKKVANFLLSVPAQAHKQKLAIWGDDTVLDLSLLTDKQRASFQTQNHPSAMSKEGYHQMLAEPHASWTDALSHAWYQRYGVWQ